MTGFDDALREALSADDEAFLKELESERGLFVQMGDAFSGPLRGWTAFAFVLSVAFFALSGYALYRMTSAAGFEPALMWLAVFVWSAIAVAMIKMWFWLRMNHLAMLRELKRLELRILALRARDDA